MTQVVGDETLTRTAISQTRLLPIEFLMVTTAEETFSKGSDRRLSAVNSHSARIKYARERHARERRRDGNRSIASIARRNTESLQLEDERSPTLPGDKGFDRVDRTSFDMFDAHGQYVREISSHNTGIDYLGHPISVPFRYQPQPTLFGHLTTGRQADRDDLMYYVAVVPSMVHGVSRDDVFQPLQEVFARSLQSAPSIRDWLLLEMDELRKGYDLTYESVTFARRRRTYRKMNKLLSDPSGRCSDELLEMVFAATCIEYRSRDGSNMRRVRIHYRGLLKLIESRGGLASLRSLAVTLSHPINCLHYLIFGELEVSNLNDAQECCRRYLGLLRRIRVFVGGMGCSMTAIRGTLYPNLRHIVHRDPESTSDMELTIHFLSVYLIVVMIWDFGPHREIAAKFLLQLTYIVKTRINSVTGETRLRHSFPTWAVCGAWLEIDATSTWHSSGQEKEVWITESALDALKVFGRLSNSLKSRLTKLLIHWICDGCGDLVHDLETRCGASQRRSTEELFVNLETECCSDFYEQRVAAETSRENNAKHAAE